ncbi:MAG: 50S ribosomal protein L29 [Bernardetiaceae bacterium]
MTNEEIRGLSLEDLASSIDTEKERLQRLRISHAISRLENPSRISKKRKLIARMLTEWSRRNRENQAS